MVRGRLTVIGASKLLFHSLYHIPFLLLSPYPSILHLRRLKYITLTPLSKVKTSPKTLLITDATPVKSTIFAKIVSTTSSGTFNTISITPLRRCYFLILSSSLSSLLSLHREVRVLQSLLLAPTPKDKKSKKMSTN